VKTASGAKGPSKENKKEPIVGLGLLLDANQIPIGMKMYPGNESEKPVIRSIIDDLKQRNNIKGRTIQVADKGLNCINNIIHALRAGDGYIFSKSVKTLPDIEKTWVLLDG
jgi:transposase